ncbi:hypothetical protein DERP_004954, partial [Dermatophagoides pteronyssinus]
NNFIYKQFEIMWLPKNLVLMMNNDNYNDDNHLENIGFFENDKCCLHKRRRLRLRRQRQLHSSLTLTSSSQSLLAGTLRTYQVSACDNEELHLECDSRTVVSIVVANYGQPVPQRHMCYRRRPSNEWPNSDRIQQKSTNDTSLSLSSNRCTEAKHLWYKFLLKIEETCREQHRCVLRVNATNLGFKQDPCGNVIKFAEVAYKCRPNQFINKIACEGRSLRLQCNDNNNNNHHDDDRIVIFSAMFGASWKGVPECPGSAINQLGPSATTNRFPNQTNIDTLCQDPDTSDIVQRICQGQRNCTILANYDNYILTSSSSSNRTFALPTCPILVKYYLKVVYTCISKHMFQNDHRIESITTSTLSSTTMMTTTTIAETTVKPIISSSTNLIDDDDDDDESIHDNDYGDDDSDNQKSSFLLKKKKIKSKTNILNEAINNGNDNISPSISSVNNNNNKNRTLSSNTKLMMDSTSIITSGKSWRTRLPHQTSSGTFSGDNSNQVLMDNPNQQHHHLAINCTELTTQMQVVGFISDWISAIGFVKRNQELFVLYLLVSLFGSLVCFLAVLSARLYYQKGVAVKKIRQEHQQQRKFVPQFDFEDDLDDEEEEDDDDDEGGRGGNGNQQATVAGDHEETQHIMKDNHRRPSSMQTTSIGRCDYGQSTKRQSMTGIIGSSTTTPTMTTTITTSSAIASTPSGGGYSTIRRPHSGHISATSGGQSSTIAGHGHYHPSFPHQQTTGTKPLISTLGRTRHHQHHHNKPSNPTVRYSGTTTRTSLSASPNTITTTTTSPKSILRDSAVQTPTPMSMMVMDLPSSSLSSSRPPITTATTSISTSPNYRGTTISFENDQKISTIDMIPPPPPPLPPSLLSAELMTTGSNLIQSSSPLMMMIDSPMVPCDVLYQQVVRCPKFPITPNCNNTIEPYGMPTTITTNSNITGKQQHQQQHPAISTVTTTPIIHSQQQQHRSLSSSDEQTAESKLLSSNLANFLV